MKEAVKIIVFFLLLVLIAGLSLQPCFTYLAGNSKGSRVMYPGYQHSSEPSLG